MEVMIKRKDKLNAEGERSSAEHQKLLDQMQCDKEALAGAALASACELARGYETESEQSPGRVPGVQWGQLLRTPETATPYSDWFITLFTSDLKQEQARSTSADYSRRYDNQGLMLLRKGDPLDFPLNTSCKIRVDKGDQLKFDPKYIISYTVVKHSLAAEYLCTIVRLRLVFVLDSPIHSPDLYPYYPYLLPSAWKEMALLTTAAISSLALKDQHFFMLLDSIDFRKCSTAWAQSCKREGYIMPHLGYACHNNS
eukprot:64031-Rhodomonas_salina.3